MTNLLDGTSRLILHLGYPTESFRAPLIYNPYFASIGLKMAVIPMGLKAEDFDSVFPSLFRLTNAHGALITMPHKIRVRDFLAEVSPAVEIAGRAMPCFAARMARSWAICSMARALCLP